MTVKIGINGFGRIGRLAFRRIFELQQKGGEAGDIEVAAINDLTSPSALAYLLKYDSTHGTFKHVDGTPVEVSATDSAIVVDGKEYPVYAEPDANNIPWVKNDGVEFVLECTGFYTSAEKSQAHLNAGAKKVLISAPAKDATTPDGRLRREPRDPEGRGQHRLRRLLHHQLDGRLWSSCSTTSGASRSAS